MKMRVGGRLPFRFDMNGWMVAGLVVGGIGIAGWTAEALGAYPEGGALGDASRGLTLAGLALYFLGRVVHLYVHYRSGR
jgi:hypothetical protein